MGKSTITTIALSALLLTACGPSAEEIAKKEYPVTDAERISYAEKTLNVTIDSQQDWVLTSQYSVKVSADADLDNINQVAVLSGHPYLGTTYALASATATKGGAATLTFRAPKASEMLYAACLTSDGQVLARPFVPGADGSVTFVENSAATSRTRVTALGQASPVTRNLASAVTRSTTTIDTPDAQTFYVKDFYTFLRAVKNFLPEGKDNRSVFGAGDYTNTVEVRRNPYSIYDLPLAFIAGKTASEADNVGYIVYPGGNASQRDTFLIKDAYTEAQVPLNYDNVTRQYAIRGHFLHCWQDNGTADRPFEPGDILTFLLAKDTDWLADAPDQRVKAFLLNGYVFIACEDGTDWDYRDRLYWMPYGAERIIKAQPVPNPEPPVPQVWTYAWEDKDFGDYDMNDCVIRVQENAADASKLDITLVALGATRNLWLGFDNKSAKNYQDYQPVFEQELHEVLGVQPGTMVNTGRASANPVTVTLSKPSGFDFQTCSFVLGAKLKEDQQGIYTNDYYYIAIATKGQDPHGIAIPGDWQWPTETTCIKDAYPEFTKWAADRTQALDWYEHPQAGKVTTK